MQSPQGCCEVPPRNRPAAGRKDRCSASSGRRSRNIDGTARPARSAHGSWTCHAARRTGRPSPSPASRRSEGLPLHPVESRSSLASDSILAGTTRVRSQGRCREAARVRSSWFLFLEGGAFPIDAEFKPLLQKILFSNQSPDGRERNFLRGDLQRLFLLV